MILPRLEGDYYTRVVLGIYEAAEQRGCKLLVLTGTPQMVVETGLGRERVIGWIVVVRTDSIDSLMTPTVPVVTIATIASSGAIPAVLPDNRGGMQAAVQHLITHGHRRIGFVGGMFNVDVQQRFEGYQAALREAEIPFEDPLLIAVESNQAQGGQAAAQQLFDRGTVVTALATATDDLAFGLMSALSAAGMHIPDDMAIVSFDDVERAQQMVPPLSTVRQRPDELGRVAVDVLLDQIAGKHVETVTYVPTALIVRQSCGCAATPAGHIRVEPTQRLAADWREALARHLVELALYPLPLQAEMPVESVWPGATLLAGGLAAALDGTAMPEAEAIVGAWDQVNSLSFDLEALNSMFSAISLTAQQRLAEHVDSEARSRVANFLDAARLGMLQARVARETRLTRYFEQVAHQNFIISMRVLGADLHRAYELHWLDQTTIQRACLGFWAETAGQRVLSIAGVYGGDGLSQLLAQEMPASAFPPSLLSDFGEPGEQEMVTLLLPLQSETRDWGILALEARFENQLDGENLIMWARLLSIALERSELLSSLTTQREQLADQQSSLQIAYDRERALADTVRELGSPVILLLPGVLLVPLVGAIDSFRAQDIIAHILEGVQHYHARTVLIDITAVSLIDTQIANTLVRTAQAISLLGAQAVMVGMRPEIAQSIVGLGLDLSTLATESSLASAIQRLLRRR